MKKVILGLSGGVDSSVALIRLKQQGYDVEAMFMRNWDSATNNDINGNPDLNDEICPQEQDYKDASRVADQLGVKMHRVDFIKEYWDYVFSYFLDEYKRGRTPNPDVMCNKEIKFKAFLQHALNMGADYIAMGHYARTEVRNGKTYLLRGVDNNKDQTYFLCQLTQEQLSKSLFPIGDMTKPMVRELALKYDLATAKKKDSTGICFIGERDFGKFLSNYLPAKEGVMMRLDGTVLGHHQGLMNYTIGQRKGLGIGGLDGFSNEPWFVVGKNLNKNILYIEQGFHHEYLYSNRAIIENVNWINDYNGEELDCQAKFRYRQPDVKVHIRWIDSETIEVTYDHVRAVTPGQACVFYQDEVCLGGGTIALVFMNGEKREY